MTDELETPRPFFARSPEEQEALAERLGGRPFHARIAREQALARGVLDYAEMTALPAGLRAKLAAAAPLLSGEELTRSVAPDRTTKLLIGFAADAHGRAGTVETVNIPPRDPRSQKGATLCVSTQVGCPVGCPFCASGANGLARNLEAHEILEQFLRGRAVKPLSRAVVMGIGEPLLNFQSLSRALELVREGFDLGARAITVSTVGFPERLRAIAPENPRFQLAISLHTPFDEQRAELVPAMAGVPIAEVLAAGDFWFQETGREITYEYVLLHGENDTAEHARALAERLAGRRATVNLIPFNPVAGSPYARPGAEDVERMQRALQSRGIVCTVRWSRGVEADAACGQLRIRTAAR